MTGIKIDKGVPMPLQRNKFPFGEMDVGDSCFIPNAGQIGGAFRPHEPKKFTTRKVTENGVVGLRVWRVS